eukprot:scaffold203736_cov41-Prasinocladus_malaysianus.AAC.1
MLSRHWLGVLLAAAVLVKEATANQSVSLGIHPVKEYVPLACVRKGVGHPMANKPLKNIHSYLCQSNWRAVLVHGHMGGQLGREGTVVTCFNCFNSSQTMRHNCDEGEKVIRTSCVEGLLFYVGMFLMCSQQHKAEGGKQPES